jgi:hypothetical protein
MLKLQLSHADGSFVDPEKTGFTLQNLTTNRRILEGGGGEELFFVLLMTQRYSLCLHGEEVWSYDKAPNLGLGLSEVCQVS